MMEKKPYAAPEMEIIELDEESILTAATLPTCSSVDPNQFSAQYSDPYPF